MPMIFWEQFERITVMKIKEKELLIYLLMFMIGVRMDLLILTMLLSIFLSTIDHHSARVMKFFPEWLHMNMYILYIVHMLTMVALGDLIFFMKQLQNGSLEILSLLKAIYHPFIVAIYPMKILNILLNIIQLHLLPNHFFMRILIIMRKLKHLLFILANVSD